MRLLLALAVIVALCGVAGASTAYADPPPNVGDMWFPQSAADPRWNDKMPGGLTRREVYAHYQKFGMGSHLGQKIASGSWTMPTQLTTDGSRPLNAAEAANLEASLGRVATAAEASPAVRSSWLRSSQAAGRLILPKVLRNIPLVGQAFLIGYSVLGPLSDELAVVLTGEGAGGAPSGSEAASQWKYCGPVGGASECGFYKEAEARAALGVNNAQPFYLLEVRTGNGSGTLVNNAYGTVAAANPACVDNAYKDIVAGTPFGSDFDVQAYCLAPNDSTGRARIATVDDLNGHLRTGFVGAPANVPAGTPALIPVDNSGEPTGTPTDAEAQAGADGDNASPDGGKAVAQALFPGQTAPIAGAAPCSGASCGTDPDAGKVALIAPNEGELPQAYKARVVAQFPNATVGTVPLTPELLDPTKGPNAIVSVAPAPGTLLDPSVSPGPTITIKHNPEDAPPPPGGASDCPCPIPAVDLEPLKVTGVCTKFPFGIFCWFVQQLASMASAPAVAPSVTLALPSFDTPLGTVAIPSLTLNAANLPGSVQTLFGAIRLVLTFLVWLIGLWYVGQRMMGARGSLDEGSAE